MHANSVFHQIYSFLTNSWRLSDHELPKAVSSPGVVTYKDTFLLVGGNLFGEIYQFVPSDYSWIRRGVVFDALPYAHELASNNQFGIG